MRRDAQPRDSSTIRASARAIDQQVRQVTVTTASVNATVEETIDQRVQDAVPSDLADQLDQIRNRLDVLEP